MIRFSSGITTNNAISKLGGLFSKYNPSYPFVYHFVDEEYAQKFDSELLVGRLAAFFCKLGNFHFLPRSVRTVRLHSGTTNQRNWDPKSTRSNRLAALATALK
jgi:hypothetical protein